MTVLSFSQFFCLIWQEMVKICSDFIEKMGVVESLPILIIFRD